jgi:hypothetical protein
LSDCVAALLIGGTFSLLAIVVVRNSKLGLKRWETAKASLEQIHWQGPLFRPLSKLLLAVCFSSGTMSLATLFVLLMMQTVSEICGFNWLEGVFSMLELLREIFLEEDLHAT